MWLLFVVFHFPDRLHSPIMLLILLYAFCEAFFEGKFHFILSVMHVLSRIYCVHSQYFFDFCVTYLEIDIDIDRSIDR